MARRRYNLKTKANDCSIDKAKKTSWCVVRVCLILLACSSWASSLLAQGSPPGVVIDSSPDGKKPFIGSPSLTVLPGGTYLATHDWFGPGSENAKDVHVFASKDRGQSWKEISKVNGQTWSTLFVLDDKVYLLGTTKLYGDLIIRQSSDEGKTWTTPTDARSGNLTTGLRYHALPVSMPIYHGRIWRAVELSDNGYKPMVMSAPVDSNLLDASSWTFSDTAQHDPNKFGGGKSSLFDGSIVAGGNGQLFNLLRVSSFGSRAAILSVSKDGKHVALDPKTAYIDFPSSNNKFIVRFDQRTNRFWTLCPNDVSPYTRINVVVLASSADLRTWKIETTLLQHCDSTRHGFMQSFWHFDGDDIIAVTGTAWGDSGGLTCPNYFTFHRYRDFRLLSTADSAPLLGTQVPFILQTKSLAVSGINLRIEEFKKGAPIFGNRSFKFLDVPKEFENWKFLQPQGGNRSNLSVKALRDGQIYCATASGLQIIDMTGWTAMKVSRFRYSDNRKTQMMIFQRSIRAGETVNIPEGNWSGSILIMPPES